MTSLQFMFGTLGAQGIVYAVSSAVFLLLFFRPLLKYRRLIILIGVGAAFFAAGYMRSWFQPSLPSLVEAAAPLKTFFITTLETIFPEPSASFFAGILLGEKRFLPPEAISAFRDTGLTHILAVSGYNVTLVVSAIQGCMTGASRRIRVITSIVCVFCFTLLVGASPSAVRAAIMGIIGLIAQSTGRITIPLITLSFTGFLMAFANPAIAQSDIGFLLSFSATLGLILLAPILKQKFSFLSERFGIREIASHTIAAQIFTFPIIFISFGSVSIIAPIANLLVLPFIPLLMVGGFFALSMGIFSLLAAKIFGFLLHFFILLLFKIILFLSYLPLSAIHVSMMNSAAFLFIPYYWILLSHTLRLSPRSSVDRGESPLPVSSR